MDDPILDHCAACGGKLTEGQPCANCAPPDLEAILRASQGITPDADGAIRAMASVHAQWRDAWAETGRFTEQETFELVRVIVAASAGGIRCLNL